MHASFADALADRGVIILGGPVVSEEDDDIGLLDPANPERRGPLHLPLCARGRLGTCVCAMI
jgi:hypothetical protein